MTNLMTEIDMLKVMLGKLMGRILKSIHVLLACQSGLLFLASSPPLWAQNSQTTAHRSASEGGKFHTVAHEILDLESAVTPIPDSAVTLLDDIIAEAKRTIKPKPKQMSEMEEKAYALETFKAIDDLLIRHNILYPEDDEDKWTLSLVEGLTPQKVEADLLERILNQRHNKRRRATFRPKQAYYFMDCDIASYVYLGIADELLLPIRMVNVPHHSFVRWQLGSKKFINWETMYGENDEDYSLFFYSPEDAEKAQKKGIYLVGIKRSEVIGYVYNVRAQMWDKKTRYKSAIDDYKHAMELYPLLPTAANNLAWLLSTCTDARIRNGREAVRFAQKAVKMYRSANYLDTLAAAYAESGNFKLAAQIEGEVFDLEGSKKYKDLADAYRKNLTYTQYQSQKTMPQTN